MGYVVNKRRFKQSGPPKYKVTLTVYNNITHTGGDLVQTDLSGPMVPVTIIPNDTYKLNQGAGTYSGITVEVSGRNLIISGTPTANVSINFTASQNADVLTSTQKNFANWNPSLLNSFDGFSLKYGVSNTSVPWGISPRQASYKREGYYYLINNTQVPVNVPFQFSLTYKVDPKESSYNNDGCFIGISKSANNGQIRSGMVGSISISGTQTEYITKTFNVTRTSDQYFYLVISNSNYSKSSGNSYKGNIRVSQMTLRQV